MQPRLSLRESTLFLTIPDDAFIGKSLEVYGEWSFGEVEFLGQALSAGDNIVEAGANIGAHTVFLARDICKAGVVYAFEPRRLLHQMLCANLSVNGVSNVHTFQTALGRESGVLTEGPMPLSGVVNSGGFSLGEIEGEEETIPIEPLDRFLPQMKRIAAIKADVEVAPLSVYAPVSVETATSPRVPAGKTGWPFCSQLQKRAASNQLTANAGQFAACGFEPVTE